MEQNISHDFDSLRLTFGMGSEGIIISSVEEAAEELLADWPGDDGDRFYEAVKACLDCLHGHVRADAAREAFIRAAIEAGIAIELEAVRIADGFETELKPRSRTQ